MTSLTGILIQGNLIASDLTIDMVSGELKGQLSENFGLSKTHKLEDEIAFAWGKLRIYGISFNGVWVEMKPRQLPASPVNIGLFRY